MKKSLILKHVGSALFILALVTVPVVAFGQAANDPWIDKAAGTEAYNSQGVSNIVESFLTFFFGILGFLAVAAFLFGGIMYLLSAGDEKRIASAKGTIMYAIIGLIVALLGYVVLRAVTSLVTISDSGAL